MNDLLLHERQTKIRKRLLNEGRVLAADLAVEFGVSDDTIRRDLREMAAQGLCKRVYGGALPVDAAEPSSILGRIKETPQRKIALAAASVSVLKPDMSVFIDAGSTNLAIVEAIPVGMPLTIITNTPLIAVSLMERSEIDIVLIGGRLDVKSGAVLGARAMQEASNYHPDLCILGSCGLDFASGISASFLEEAEFNRLIVQHSRHTLAAVTNEKLGVAASFHVVPLEACNTLVVEADADRQIVSDLEGRGLQIIRAD